MFYQQDYDRLRELMRIYLNKLSEKAKRYGEGFSLNLTVTDEEDNEVSIYVSVSN